jgi:hypothetical protein
MSSDLDSVPGAICDSTHTGYMLSPAARACAVMQNARDGAGRAIVQFDGRRSSDRHCIPCGAGRAILQFDESKPSEVFCRSTRSLEFQNCTIAGPAPRIDWRLSQDASSGLPLLKPAVPREPERQRGGFSLTRAV